VEQGQSTPADLSVPDRANASDTSCWSAESALTQNRRAVRTLGQLLEVRDGTNLTIGGCTDIDAKDW
jgi:hypothetical protein